MGTQSRVVFCVCLLGAGVMFGQQVMFSGTADLEGKGPFAPAALASTKEDTALASGVPVFLSIPAVTGPAIDVTNQLTIDVPAGATSLWIELAPDDEKDDFGFAVRFGVHVDLNAGQIVADAGSLSPGGYEELGFWGTMVQPGTYYIAIASNSTSGGNLTLTATVDGAIVELTSGTAAPFKVPADDDGADSFVSIDGQQFHLAIPADATSLSVQVEMTDPTIDAMCAFRYGSPCEASSEGALTFDFATGISPGFGEAFLLPPDDLKPGQDLYVWLWNGAGPDDQGAARALAGTLRLDINGAILDLTSGTPVDCKVGSDSSAPGDRSVNIDGQQFRISIPAEAQSLFVRFQADDLALDSLVAFRYGQPGQITDAGALVYDFNVDLVGGLDEWCFTPADVLQPGQDLYAWVFNDAGNGKVLAGTLLLAIDGCATPIGRQETVDGVVGASKVPAGTLLGAQQYAVTMAAPLSELRISVAATDVPVDLDLFVAFDSPVVNTGGVPSADYSAVTVGTSPEEIVIPLAEVTAGTYYIAVGTNATSPAPYTLIVEGGTSSISIFMGNVNTDNVVNIADAVALLGYLFAQKAPPVCAKAADANDDDILNIADAVAILGYQFSGKDMLAPDHASVTAANNTCKPYDSLGKDIENKPYFPPSVSGLEACATSCTP